jgi:ATP adenylyltransferase
MIRRNLSHLNGINYGCLLLDVLEPAENRQRDQVNMERIWAPWRIDYILGDEKESGCIFCTKPAAKEDDDNLIVHRAVCAFTMMNKFPYNNGHLLVVPYRHVSDICLLEPDENSLLVQEVCRALQVLRHVMRPDGFNIGINLGKSAGAGIEEHVHYHIVPRWNGDTNIMPVLADIKVIPEHLGISCKKLQEGFAKLYPQVSQEEEK